MKEELLKSLTEEQIARARKCKTNEELLKLAKDEGYELTAEQLEAVTGGACFQVRKATQTECPQCGKQASQVGDPGISDSFVECHCDSCGFTWRSPVR